MAPEDTEAATKTAAASKKMKMKATKVGKKAAKKEGATKSAKASKVEEVIEDFEGTLKSSTPRS